MIKNYILSRIATILFLMVIIGSTSAQTTLEVSGTITENTTWSDDTIKVTGNVIVDFGNTLTILPGTWIECQGHFEIKILGSIRAIGTSDSSIVFSVNDTTGFSNLATDYGSWEGLMIDESFSTDSSYLVFCSFSYAKQLSSPFMNDKGGALNISLNSNVLVSDCLFTDNVGSNGGAIHCYGFIQPAIRNNTIINNYALNDGGAIYCYEASPHIINNIIKNNGTVNRGTITTWNNADPLIESNIIADNMAPGGAVHAAGNGKGRIINNFIVNNDAGSGIIGGIGCGIDGLPFISGNIISNNKGCGIYCETGNTSLIINNTICNNYSEYGGISTKNANPKIYNTIIYGNSTTTQDNQVYCFYYYMGTAFPDFYYCNIQDSLASFGGILFEGKYENNLAVDPVFVNPTADAGTDYDALLADWSLRDTSLCINHGTPETSMFGLPASDIEGNSRVIHGRIDIGAVEKHIESITVSGDILNDTIWTADTVKINSDIEIQDNAVLTIPAGTVVEFQDYYSINVLGTIIAEGKENDSILFTVKNPGSGSWAGIYYNNGVGAANGSMNDNQHSRFQYCIFQYSHKDGATAPEMRGGVFYILYYSNISFDHCTFRYNSSVNQGGVFWMIESIFTASDCQFYSNYSPRGGVFYIVNSQCNFNNLQFFENTSTYEGGAIYSSYSDLNFYSSHISNNAGGSGWYGGGIFYRGGHFTMINSIVSNNTGKVGGIFFDVSEVSIINSNILNNSGSDVAGGIFFRGSNGAIINSVITGNSSNMFGYSQIQLNDDLSDPDIINSNIQDGIEGIILNPGHLFTGRYENCIDTDPMFVEPSAGAGPDHDGMHADWSVFNVSPNINAGTTDTTGLNVGNYDLLGHSRINNDVIDIGAIENQGSAPSVILQPAGKTLCSGESMLFQISCFDTVSYQWQRNGVDIPGETTNELFIPAVSTGDQGNYWCIVTNSYGSVTSNTATLFVNDYPEFLQQPQNMWAEPGNTVTLRTYARGTSPYFTWQKDGMVLPGEVTPELNLTAVDYSDEGVYRCIVTNVCGADTTSPAVLYLADQICMVTFDPASGDNLVVWEKQSSAPLDEYNIYRESSAAGIYDLLGTVGYSELSVFVDTAADPTVQAYLYKIAGVDTSGFETDLDLCAPHKTIHLLVSTNPELNTTQLQWDKYYGFDYPSYIIYRSPTGVGFTPIHYLQSTLHSWTDPSPLPDVGYYRIGVTKEDPCVPTGGGKKADSGSYSYALSNTEDNRLQDQGNQEPEAILLSNNAVDENQSIGSFVGRLETTDPDTSDNHIYKLAAGEGAEDNHRFTTLGDLLITAEELDYETRDTCYVRIKTTDKGDLSIEQTFTIIVNDVDESIPNDPPAGLTISSTVIAENKPAGSLVGRLWTDDPDVIDNHTYSFVSGTGDEDNDRFMILDDMLLSDEGFDYETQDALYVRIRSTDQGDLSVEGAFTITVTDVNEGSGNLAPTGILLNANTIEENRQSGSLVGAFSTADPNPGDDHAYSLVDGLGADDNDDFMIMGNILISGAEFDYETSNTLFVRVESTDQGGLSFEAAFIILVSDVFEAAPNLSPTEILLSSDEVDENMPALTMVGRLQTDDPNMDDLHSYLLVEGDGDDDNNSFVLVGDVLFSTVIFDYELQDEYNVRIQSADDGEGSLSTEKSFTIHINDLLELGMNDIMDDPGKLSIYPNPFTHTTVIEFSNPDKAKYRMYITDLAGKVVHFEGDIFSDKLELSRNDLPAGVYFVELRGERIYRGKLVIE